MDKILKITDEMLKKFEDSFEAQKDIISKTKAVEEDSGTFKVVISTEDVDRAGESIKADGWDLTNYKKNPVVLWGHSHFDLPIGMATSVKVEGKKLIAEGKFATHPMAQEVRKLYEMGVVKATSVGFIPKVLSENGEEILKAELLEFSFVSVPMNPNALSLLQASELSIDSLLKKGLIDFKTFESKSEEEPEEEEEPTEPKEEKEEKEEEEKDDEDDVEEEEVEEEVDEEEKNVTQMDRIEKKLDEIIAFQESVKAGPKGNKIDDFKSYKEGREILQKASTIIGDVLAEARKGYESKREKKED